MTRLRALWSRVFWANRVQRGIDADQRFQLRSRDHSEITDPVLCCSYFDPINRGGDGRLSVLFVTHELSHTGAPHMVREAAKAVKNAEGLAVIVSPVDGPLRATLEDDEIVVIIDPSVGEGGPTFEGFAQSFDAVVVSTFVLRSLIERLSVRCSLPIIWWLHESKALETLVDIPSKIWRGLKVVCNSNYSRSFLPATVDAEILYYGVPDRAHFGNPPARGEKFKFVLIGTIEPRKGQDLFIDAILGLPERVRSGCEFVMAGKLWPNNEVFWERLAPIVASNPEIHYVGDLSHEGALSLIATCDALVSCSRDEAFSLVAVEAALHGKAVIMSDRVGAGEVFGKRCVSIFPNEDVGALRQEMSVLYNDRSRCTEMGTFARRVYAERLSAGMFHQSFLKMVRAVASETTKDKGLI